MFQDISSKKKFLKFFFPLTDRKILQINYVNSWFLTISQTQLKFSKKICSGMHFEVLSTKYVNFNHFRQFFENFVLKISLFLAIFLEFFVLGNNHTLQDPLYTRSITLILCIERNKKIRFQTNSTCKFATWTWH